MDNAWREIRYAVRRLIRKPGFTLPAIATLALGIGANCSIFSAINAFLLRPLPFEQPAELVHLFQTDSQRDWNPKRFALPTYYELERQVAERQASGRRSGPFTEIAAYDNQSQNLSSDVGEPQCIIVGRLSVSALDTLGVQPALGGAFRAQHYAAVVLAVLGGAVGLFVADGMLRLLKPSLPETLYRVGQLGVDRDVLIFAALLSVVTALVFGLAPAREGIKANPATTLKQGGSSLSGGSRRFGRFLVVAKIRSIDDHGCRSVAGPLAGDRHPARRPRRRGLGPCRCRPLGPGGIHGHAPVLRDGLRLAILGLVVGIPIAWLSTWLASRWVPGLTSAGLVAFIGIPILLAGVAALATYLPACQALRINPAELLRVD